MKIKRDKSGNLWMDGVLCVNIPIKAEYISELQQRAISDYSYEDLTEIIDSCIHYHLYGKKDH